MKKQTAKNFTHILTVLIMSSMLFSCGQKEAEENDGIKTDSVENQESETVGSGDEATEKQEVETEPETEPETETEASPVEVISSELPKQDEVPCDFDNALDLSDDILVSEFLLQENGGQWILGDDNTQMTNAITEDLLNEYRYFAFTYTCEDCDADSQIALMCKFVHTDDTKTEILCEDWFMWGPADMTYHASSFAVMNVFGTEGVFYVPTEMILAHEAFQAGDIINQIGLAGVEYTGTYVNLSITGAYLTK